MSKYRRCSFWWNFEARGNEVYRDILSFSSFLSLFLFYPLLFSRKIRRERNPSKESLRVYLEQIQAIVRPVHRLSSPPPLSLALSLSVFIPSLRFFQRLFQFPGYILPFVSRTEGSVRDGPEITRPITNESLQWRIQTTFSTFLCFIAPSQLPISSSLSLPFPFCHFLEILFRIRPFSLPN